MVIPGGSTGSVRSFVTVASTVVLAVIAIVPASASFHTFQINEIYSNRSGSVQFIELLEGFGVNGQQFLSGHTLTITQGATTHTFTFPNNLPGSTTAGAHVLIATPAFAALGIVTPDYIVPPGFLFASDATVNYAGVDSVTYGSLPADGVSSLGRSGTAGPNSPSNFAGQSGTIGPAASAAAAAVPTLWNGAVAALSVLMLIMVRTTHSRRCPS
jgi:hypothetical protein